MNKLMYTILLVFGLSIFSTSVFGASIKTIKHEYDSVALKKEALEKAGEAASILGTVTKVYSDGVESSTQAKFSQSAKDGVFSAVSVDENYVQNLTSSNIWMLLATFLVFIMHLGFSALEVSLTRAKNTVNILFKNASIIAIGLLTYAFVGFKLHYPGGWLIEGILPQFGFGIGAGDDLLYNAGYTSWTDFLFQGMFAATAATIVSGAVAERIKLSAFLLFSFIFVMLAYPIIGSWHWGGGFLAEKFGFYDFAGSTVVHSVGGWAALACVMILGPRAGKYINGTIKPIMGHNLPLASCGVFLLWFGWFGFNGGSVLSADANGISFVCVTTSLAAAAGIVGSVATSWIVQKTPDLTMALNGALAGLVGITAGADQVSAGASVLIGLIAGIIVVFSIIGLDKAKIDDPVGATSVHLVCGIWGTLAVALFSSNEQITFYGQLVGVVAVGVAAFISAYILFYIIKVIMGVRVNEKEELIGLDITEHKMEAYSGFQIFNNK